MGYDAWQWRSQAQNFISRQTEIENEVLEIADEAGIGRLWKISKADFKRWLGSEPDYPVVVGRLDKLVKEAHELWQESKEAHQKKNFIREETQTLSHNALRTAKQIHQRSEAVYALASSCFRLAKDKFLDWRFRLSNKERENQRRRFKKAKQELKRCNFDGVDPT